MNIAVIMDIVHSHAVKNEVEALGKFPGDPCQYFYQGGRREHPAWDSLCFDYGKNEVIHFLLSNCKYWLEEFHFDGFRFDGVTSMLYYSHGLGEAFCNYGDYFNGHQDDNAICYLTLANRLVHDFRPSAVTIAEDVSGMPGMCFPAADGGIGFDYRLGMAIPDYWIKLLKEVPDEEWNIWEMWHMMVDRLGSVKTVAYCESHDQALVGDKTIAFRLMDKQMYTDMNRAAENLIIDRGMALHKMIRLFTISLAGEAYLNFMGNEFGHPEWIDFPREGNGWSYAHARRQWSLSTNGFLRYSFLGAFDRAMLELMQRYDVLASGFAYNHQMDEENKTIVFSHRGDLVFIFNWHPQRSIPDYEATVPAPGKYRIELSSDEKRFGGYGRIDETLEAFSTPRKAEDGSVTHFIKVYNLSRAALVLKKVDE